MTGPLSDRSSAGPAVGELTRPTTRVAAEAHLAAAAYLLPLLSATDVSRAVAEGRDLESTRVHQVVTGPPRAVKADLPARDAARVMLPHGVMQPLVCSDDRVLGIADRADVCRAVLASDEAAVLPRRPAAGPPAP
jgi:hypothetical protein